jgi:CubicO group peptidase (beta-lactamase class C family)
MINGTCDPRFKKVQDAFLKTFKTEFETGAALAVELDGELVINLWGGYQDASRTKAWQEDTLVNVFSVTKGVTATCISRLIDQGKLDPKYESSSLLARVWLQWKRRY